MMSASDQVGSIRSGNAGSQDFPLLQRSERDFGREWLLKSSSSLIRLSQFGIGDGLGSPNLRNLAILNQK
jgi:hypothetical protein